MLICHRGIALSPLNIQCGIEPAVFTTPECSNSGKDSWSDL